ncbi:MAG: hypothetical protein IMZ65_03195, partial [Planctomycetes bacterium]|nr:hypothetical protein [Planctomycetota bacterium]
MMMRQLCGFVGQNHSCYTAIAMLGVMLVAQLCLAQSPPRPAGRALPASARPAAPLPDLVRDLFDDFSEGEERARFFEAAGIDGELSQEEFKAAAGQRRSFVRPCDRWELAAAYNRPRTGRLTWQQALEYRRSVQKRVLALFDRDKDGKLAGAERDLANAYLNGRSYRLSASSLPAAEAATQPGEGGVADPAAGQPFTWEDCHASYEALRDEFNRRSLIDFDQDHDGQLDDEERRAMADEYLHQEKLWKDYWDVVRWDADRNGQLDANEVAAKDAEEELRRHEVRQQFANWFNQADLDGDGIISPAEDYALNPRWHDANAARRRQNDLDGDGQLTGDEIRAARTVIFEEIRQNRLALE